VSSWPSVKAKALLKSLLRIGWEIKRQSGSHKTLRRDGWPDFVFSFHDGEEIGPECWLASRNTRASRPISCSRTLWMLHPDYAFSSRPLGRWFASNGCCRPAAA
jgi:predicted RNA binding protein YcfA (HicA-like mRNA interferase family)